MNKQDFLKQYQTKEWYEISRRIKARDHNTCQMCGRNDVPLSVHHMYYGIGGDIFGYTIDKYLEDLKTNRPDIYGHILGEAGRRIKRMRELMKEHLPF